MGVPPGEYELTPRALAARDRRSMARRWRPRHRAPSWVSAGGDDRRGGRRDATPRMERGNDAHWRLAHATARVRRLSRRAPRARRPSVGRRARFRWRTTGPVRWREARFDAADPTARLGGPVLVGRLRRGIWTPRRGATASFAPRASAGGRRFLLGAAAGAASRRGRRLLHCIAVLRHPAARARRGPRTWMPPPLGGRAFPVAGRRPPPLPRGHAGFGRARRLGNGTDGRPS